MGEGGLERSETGWLVVVCVTPTNAISGLFPSSFLLLFPRSQGCFKEVFPVSPAAPLRFSLSHTHTHTHTSIHVPPSLKRGTVKKRGEEEEREEESVYVVTGTTPTHRTRWSGSIRTLSEHSMNDGKGGGDSLICGELGWQRWNCKGG